MKKITRRQFSAGVLGAAAGTLALRSSPLRADEKNEKINIAMIACGGRGEANLGGVLASKMVNITALCDVNSKAVEKQAAKYPGAKTFTDFRKVFDHPADFDAVIVSTCEHTHA